MKSKFCLIFILFLLYSCNPFVEGFVVISGNVQFADAKVMLDGQLLGKMEKVEKVEDNKIASLYTKIPFGKYKMTVIKTNKNTISKKIEINNDSYIFISEKKHTIVVMKLFD